MSGLSSELSPQSSSPSHTHACSLHSVLLQMNSSGRQKKAPGIAHVEKEKKKRLFILGEMKREVKYQICFLCSPDNDLIAHSSRLEEKEMKQLYSKACKSLKSTLVL